MPVRWPPLIPTFRRFRIGSKPKVSLKPLVAAFFVLAASDPAAWASGTGLAAGLSPWHRIAYLFFVSYRIIFDTISANEKRYGTSRHFL